MAKTYINIDEQCRGQVFTFGSSSASGESNLTLEGGLSGTAGLLTVKGDVVADGIVNASGQITGLAGIDISGGNIVLDSSDIIVNTNMFTVDGATGNTLVAGTFDATGNADFNGGVDVETGNLTVGAGGNIIVNTNMFTVDGANGDTLVAGTLNVDGDADFDADVTVTPSGILYGSTTLTEAELIAIKSGTTHTHNREDKLGSDLVMNVLTLANASQSSMEQVYWNGQLLTSGAGNDYTVSHLAANSTITFMGPPYPDAADRLCVLYLTNV